MGLEEGGVQEVGEFGRPAIWFCVRQRGVASQQGWVDYPDLHEFPAQIGANGDGMVEVCVTEQSRPVPPDQVSRVFCNRARGVVGVEIAYRDETVRLTPTRMLTSNLRFGRVFERFRRERDLSVSEFKAHRRLSAFGARQFLLSADGWAGATELYRGSTLVAPRLSDAEDRAADVAEGIARWMLNNLSPEGGLPYKYWPSQGEVAPSDNAIRRFLATLSLARFAKLRGDAEMAEAARRNLHFNLRRYFQNIGGGRGAIVERTGAKLGAAALAALCILESPARREFATELKLLTAGVNSLADEELGFRTFFFPAERDGENWNFYSGEALLFWAEAARRGIDGAPTLERCVTTLERCGERHRQARNPAFVPWHAQAGASLFAQTGRREVADYVFEMSDWLLPMQQWDGLDLDLRGRFYDPRHPEFGPPHAASTGAYLEGFADALALAGSLGDEARAAAYERVIARGLRSLRQLQFRGPHDTFYISKKKRVLGALRTEAYDNAVRVDSAAHALAAAEKLLRRRRTQPVGGRT